MLGEHSSSLCKGPWSTEPKSLANSPHRLTSQVRGTLEAAPPAPVKPSNDYVLADVWTVASREIVSQRHPAKPLPNS